MTAAFRNLLKSIQKAFTGAPQPPAAKPDAVPMAAATLLAEVARVDHAVKDIDLSVARDALQSMFALPADEADAMVVHALRPENRPTSYHGIVSALNRHLTPEDKIRLVEQLWRIAQADREIDMYEDHLVRKVSDLLYVPHREFIAAKHRARH